MDKLIKEIKKLLPNRKSLKLYPHIWGRQNNLILEVIRIIEKHYENNDRGDKQTKH